jgi:hypothetical protein
MAIVGIEGLSVDQLNFELQRGAKFVVFQYAFSVVIMSFRRGSEIHFIRGGESTAAKSARFTLLTLVAGWWGIPWGPIYTIQALTTNFRGGKNVTAQVLAAMNNPSQSAAPPPPPPPRV